MWNKFAIPSKYRNSALQWTQKYAPARTPTKYVIRLQCTEAYFWVISMILKLVCKLHVQIAGLCEAEEDRVPRGEVPRAGRGRQDAGHGLHARRQEDRQRSQHACQGRDSCPIFLSKNFRVRDKLWCSRQLSPTPSERFPQSSSMPTSSSQVKLISKTKK